VAIQLLPFLDLSAVEVSVVCCHVSHPGEAGVERKIVTTREHEAQGLSGKQLAEPQADHLIDCLESFRKLEVLRIWFFSDLNLLDESGNLLAALNAPLISKGS
jgi:hypothetical protein